MTTAAIANGIQYCLYLGNINAQRDCSNAKDYVEDIWRILQQSEADEYLIATGVTKSIRNFVRMAFHKNCFRT